jgi:tetratricopeptide (TPR) repeat protein
VFAAPFDVGAAELMLGPDQALRSIDKLVEHSLLSLGQDGRYRMLESVRDFGRGQLSDEERDMAWHAHAEWIRQRIGDDLRRPHQLVTDQAWSELRVVVPDLAAALRRAVDSHAPVTQETEAMVIDGARVLARHAASTSAVDLLLASFECVSSDGARLTLELAIADMEVVLGLLDDGLRRAERVVALARRLDDRSTEAAALATMTEISERRGDLRSSRALLEQRITLHEELREEMSVARGLVRLGDIEHKLTDIDSALMHLEAGALRCRRLGSEVHAALATKVLSQLALADGDYLRARALAEECLSVFRRFGHGAATFGALSTIGDIAAQVGDLDDAAASYIEATAIARELGDVHQIAVALVNASSVERLLGRFAAAREMLDEAITLAARQGFAAVEAAGHLHRFRVLRELGDLAAARVEAAAALAIGTRLDSRSLIGQALNQLGAIDTDLGAFDTARAYLEQAVSIARDVGRVPAATVLAALGRACALEGDHVAARHHAIEGLELLRGVAATSLVEDLEAQVQSAEAAIADA